MATLTVRNVPDDVVSAMRIEAARRGRSMEAELRALIAATYPKKCGISIDDAQRRFAAMWTGKPPEHMVDDFLAFRKENDGE